MLNHLLLKQMKQFNLKNIVIGLLVGLLGLLGVTVGGQKLGGVPQGQAYQATTTDSVYANKKVPVKLGSGVLGSVVITGTSATVVELRNATSSTDVASTTIVTFAASAGTNTYTFDSSFDRGLVANFIGSFAGQYTITYR